MTRTQIELHEDDAGWLYGILERILAAGGVYVDRDDRARVSRVLQAIDCGFDEESSDVGSK